MWSSIVMPAPSGVLLSETEYCDLPKIVAHELIEATNAHNAISLDKVFILLWL